VKLDWLKIPKYKNLVNFEIHFDETQPTAVLLGKNGTGKSYLFEAIVEIFCDLEQGLSSPFPYEIQFLCRDDKVRVRSQPRPKRTSLTISVNNKDVSAAEFYRRRDNYLPKYVFAYYSGSSSRLERHFDGPTRRYYEAILNSEGKAPPLRRMFFCRRDYSQLVLLAFFLSHNPESDQILREYLKIAEFESVLFVLKKPWWGKNKSQTGRGDPRFWNAYGAFRGFLDVLWTQCLAPIHRHESVERDIRRQQERTERLYVFIKDLKSLKGLVGDGGHAKELFGYLDSIYLCDLIDEVRVNVKHEDGTKISFKQLSEGEQQLLTVLGLLLFTQDDESLYLLDEPDTHLNPVWTYKYLELLEKTISASKGHLLLATHNPLMIGSLHKSRVRVFGAEGGSITATEPEYDPIGVGIEGLLKSELYGLRSSLAQEVLDDIDMQNRLLGLSTRTSKQDKQLQEATNRLNALGVTRSHPNPLFDLFAKAIASQPIFQKPVLSKDEIAAQEVLADKILDGILKDTA
jgi:predicted ATPase